MDKTTINITVFGWDDLCQGSSGEISSCRHLQGLEDQTVGKPIQMGSGYMESVYERCMLIELKKAGLYAKSQHPIKVLYENQIVGEFISDLIIEESIIVELKAISQLTKIHEAQLVNYLVSTGKDIGLLINFGPEKVQIKRKIRLLK